MQHKKYTQSAVELLAGNGLPSLLNKMYRYFSLVLLLGSLALIKGKVFPSDTEILISISLLILSFVIHFYSRFHREIVKKRDKNLLENNFVFKVSAATFICFIYSNIVMQFYQVII